MYDIRLTEAFFPPQTDGALRDITVGELLRETSDHYSDAVAMVDNVTINAVATKRFLTVFITYCFKVQQYKDAAAR